MASSPASGDGNVLFPADIAVVSLQQQADTVEAWFELHKSEVRFSGSNRIATMCRVVRECSGTEIEPDDSRHPTLIQALKDVQEFWFVIEMCGDRLLAPPFLPRLTRCFTDPLLTGDSGGDTAGRDAQFELFVGALAQRAGFGVDDFDPESADWKLTVPNQIYSVETKRIKNIDRLEKHIRKAANQIHRSGVGGVIIADVSRAVWPEGSTLDRHVPDAVLDDARKRRGIAFFEEYGERLRRWIAEKSVGAIILHDHVIRPAGKSSEGVFVPWGLHTSWDSYQMMDVESDHRPRYEEFWSLFSAALPQI